MGIKKTIDKKCAILLVRVSTQTQDYQPQIDDLYKFAESKGFDTFHVIGTKESGLVDFSKKAGTNELFEFIEANQEYKVVFTTELSRIARRQSALHQIKEWLIKNQVQLHVKDTGYSLFDPNGKLSVAGEMMFALYGFFAESEINQKKDRFRRAKKSLMESGLSISGKTLFGYERVEIFFGKTKRSTLIPHPQNAEVVRLVFNWYINGFEHINKEVSVRMIALECIKRNFPKYTHSKRNVNKMLKEPAYLGIKTTNNKRKNPEKMEDDDISKKYITTQNLIKYPVLLDQQTFDQVQIRLKLKNSRVEKSVINTTLLSKLLECNSCENHLNGNYRILNGRDVSNYRCGSRGKTNPCSNKQTLGMDMIDSAIWCLIKSDLNSLKKIIDKVNPDKILEELKLIKVGLSERLQQIEEETLTYSQSLSNYSKMKNISIFEFMSTLESKVAKLDKEKGKILSEIKKNDDNIMIYDKGVADIPILIAKNLNIIEKSKDLLKKYISTYVNKIQVLLHNRDYTVLKIFFRVFSHMESSVYKEGDLDEVTYLILEKDVTQDIKLYVGNTLIKQCSPKTSTIKLVDNSLRKPSNKYSDKSFPNPVIINLKLIRNGIYSQYFKQIPLIKLGINFPKTKIPQD
jgi:DNA invertase Pin-like site-specific DNA recombinase